MAQGRVHINCIMDTNDRSLSRPDRRVSQIKLIMWNTFYNTTTSVTLSVGGVCSVTHRRDSEQICRERVKTEGSESKCDVRCRWRRRNENDKSNDIQRPKIVIFKCFPQTPWRDSLTIVHVSFGRVVTENAVDDNGNLTIGKPTAWSVPSLGLHRGRRHHEEGDDADNECDEPFDEKEPPLFCPAGNAAEVQKDEGKERGDDTCHRQSRPEVAVTRKNGLFIIREEVHHLSLMGSSFEL